MTTIAIDGLSEENFRRAIENRLREGAVDAALERLRRLLQPYAGPGKVLPQRFLTVTSAELELTGWDGLSDALDSHDREGRPITAMSVTFGWPGDDAPQPDEGGNLAPHIETSYYSDDAFPFSKSTRTDLLEGYSYHGCTWSADCEATDHALGLAGIDDLQGALTLLEADLLASEEPAEDGILAGSLGACLLSVLLFEAVQAKISSAGLPRPLCVMAGSNDVYPYFDAPVAGMPEEACKAAEEAEEELQYNLAVPGPRYSSLLMANIPRARKRMALVLDETPDETEIRVAHMRGIDIAEPHAPITPVPEPEVMARSESQGIVPIPGGPLMTKKPHGVPSDFRDMLGPREPLTPPPFEPELPEPSGFEGLPIEPEPVEPDPAGPTALTFDPVHIDSPEPVAAGPEAVESQPDVSSPAPEPVLEPLAEAPSPEPELAVEPVAEALAPEPEASSEPGSASEAQPRVVIALEPGPRQRAPVLQPQPGFALLEPNLQERLQALIAGQLTSPPKPLALEPVAPVEPEQPAEPAPVACEAPPEPEPEPEPVQQMECIRFDAKAWTEYDDEPAPQAVAEEQPRRGLLARLRHWWSGN